MVCSAAFRFEVQRELTMKAVFRKVGFQRRRTFVLCLLWVMVGRLVEAEEPNGASSSKQPPNLLFIAIDDLNDWD